MSDGATTNSHIENSLSYSDIYSVMGSGNENYEVLIKGNESVYGYDAKNNKIDYLCKLKLEEYQYTKSQFVDGRDLLILGMNPIKRDEEQINSIKILKIDIAR